MQDDPVTRFHALAVAYCEFIETQERLTREELIEQSLFHLSSLYHGALQLPVPPPDETEDPDEAEEMQPHPSIEELKAQILSDPVLPALRAEWERWRSLDRALCAKFEPRNYYLEIFDPWVEDEPVHGSLADDLSGVYGNLREGLESWDNGDRDQAVFEWYDYFIFHWGHHALDAMRALHCLRYRNY